MTKSNRFIFYLFLFVAFFSALLMQGCSNKNEETTSGGSGASEGDQSESGGSNSIEPGETQTHSAKKVRKKGNKKSEQRHSQMISKEHPRDNPFEGGQQQNARAVQDHGQDRMAASQELNHAEAELAAKLEKKRIRDQYEEEKKARAEERALKH